jgi:hypothetical protein
MGIEGSTNEDTTRRRNTGSRDGTAVMYWLLSRSRCLSVFEDVIVCMWTDHVRNNSQSGPYSGHVRPRVSVPK